MTYYPFTPSSPLIPLQYFLKMHELLRNYNNLSSSSSYLSSMRYTLAKSKLDALFIKWLYNNKDFASQMISQAQQNTLKPTDFPSPLYSHHRPPHHPLDRSMINTITPPKPNILQSSIQINQSDMLDPNTSVLGRSVIINKTNRNSVDVEVVPLFFVNGGRPIDTEIETQYKTLINKVFDVKGELTYQESKNLFKQVIELPTYFCALLYERLGKQESETLKKQEFINYWKSELQNKDLERRAYHLLKKPTRSYLVHDDFKPLLKDVLAVHPGLEFLKQTPEFQDWYSICVINRIFYTANKKLDGKLNIRQYKRSKITTSFWNIENENDINRNREFFSYEDFYVIYIKFWELDVDHDFLLTKEEFSKYSGYTLSRKVVERIYSQCARKFQEGGEKMTFGDFVWFILSEQDKTTQISIEFWFKILDLDNNGILTGYQLQYFFQEQNQRLIFLNSENAVNFENVVCQMVDLLKPKEGIMFRVEDFLKQKGECGVFLNFLTNLNKLVAYEQRDAYQIRSEKMENPDYTEWERFVKPEYRRIESNADDGEGNEVLGVDDD